VTGSILILIIVKKVWTVGVTDSIPILITVKKFLTVGVTVLFSSWSLLRSF
jgi:hypothetical protein